MPRKRKSYPELEALRHLLGKVPDHEVAARAGTSASIVGRYRRSLKVAAYDGYKFGNGPVDGLETASSPSKVAKKAKKKPTETSPRVGKAAAPAGRTGSSTGRKSKIAPFQDQVGNIPDKDVAKLAGVSTEAVRMYRRRRGIELNLPQRPSESKKRSPSRRKSRLDPYFDELGRVPDAEIAARAGVTPENVRAYRSRHGIKAEYRERRRLAVRAAKDASVAAGGSATRGGPTPAGAAQGGSEASSALSLPSSHAYAIQVSGSEETWVLVAEDVAKAAVQALAALEGIVPGGRIGSITYVGRALR